MNRCPYCGYPAYGYRIECAKCHFPLARGGTLYSPTKGLWIGADRAHEIRRKALAVLALGLLLKVYWGGYGPWPVVTPPALDHLRSWVEPLFTEGGAVAYALGWILKFF